ncbi:hypothetical protein ABPG77_003705 [Micractinium sp. CCAP 211/92]
MNLLSSSFRLLAHASVQGHTFPAACTQPTRVRSLVPVRASGSKSSAMPQEVDPQAYNSRWEDMWTADGGLKPGQRFDATQSPPVLSRELANGGLSAAEARVLIPGCGRGYDVETFVRAGASSVAGLELAPTAQQAAREYLEGALSAEEKAKAQVHAGDFFKWACPSGQPFDLGFDYTFMCALHPDMRGDWAASWARLLRPGATLACLAFPIDPERGTGPPWPVTPQQYKDLLLPAGFALEREEPVPPELSHPGRGGMECWLLFKRL